MHWQLYYKNVFTAPERLLTDDSTQNNGNAAYNRRNPWLPPGLGPTRLLENQNRNTTSKLRIMKESFLPTPAELTTPCSNLTPQKILDFILEIVAFGVYFRKQNSNYCIQGDRWNLLEPV